MVEELVRLRAASPAVPVLPLSQLLVVMKREQGTLALVGKLVPFPSSSSSRCLLHSHKLWPIAVQPLRKLGVGGLVCLLCLSQPVPEGWAISKHGVVLANQSIVVRNIEHFDRTRATELYLLSNQSSS